MINVSRILTCGHCHNIGRMDILGSVSDTTQDLDKETGFSREYGILYNVLLCPACSKSNIVSFDWHEDMEEAEIESIEYEILYPVNQDAPKGLPDKISNAYISAEKVKQIDVNAYAILSRRLLELVCLDRGATGKTLAAMLQDLSEKGEIPNKLVDVARGLKDFGNIGAHVSTGELSQQEIPIVEALTKAILEYIYSAPYLASLAEKKLKVLKSHQK
jgi:uncharacterized protein YbaR (Trm112 family)